MAINSIEEGWDAFAEMVFANIKPHKTQVTDMKKAFFAGALALFTTVDELAQSDIADNVAEAHWEARREELLAFGRKIMREYAERN